MNWAEHHLVKTGDVLRVADWAPFDWLVAGFSLRSAGNIDKRFGETAEVVAAQQRVMHDVGAEGFTWIFMQQVHEATIVEVKLSADEQDSGEGIVATDAVITSAPAQLLTVMVADCVPILVVDPEAKRVAVFHAGRRGSTAEIARKGVARMVELGSAASNLQAAIGPSICPRCYEIGPGQYFDLWAENEKQLREAGVATVIRTDVCTKEHNDLFFSHRADEIEGRFAGVIGIKS